MLRLSPAVTATGTAHLGIHEVTDPTVAFLTAPNKQMIRPTDLPDIPFHAGDDAPSAFREVVKRRGGQIAFIFKGQKTTWAELGERVNRVANALIAFGITKGDRVALLSRNSVRYVEAFFGALSAGACVVPLPTMVNSDALKRMIENATPKALLASNEFAWID